MDGRRGWKVKDAAIPRPNRKGLSCKRGLTAKVREKGSSVTTSLGRKFTNS